VVDAGVVICLERGVDLHTTHLMPLPPTVSCSSKIQIGFTFLVRLTWVVLDKGPLSGCKRMYHVIVVYELWLLLLRTISRRKVAVSTANSPAAENQPKNVWLSRISAKIYAV